MLFNTPGFQKMLKSIALLLSLGGMLLGATHAHAVACNSLATGNWGTIGTWSCGHVPLATDDVTIVAGHTITMNSNPGRALSLTINGTASWAANRTTNVGVGGVIIPAGGNIAGTASGILTSTGGLVLNANLTSTTVTVTLQTTAAQTISGTGSLARLTVTGAGVTATNTGTLTVSTALAGTGKLSNTGTLSLGGTSAITTLTATAVGNIVNYTGAAAQTIKATTYATLNTSGAGIKTIAAATVVNNALTNNSTLTITGALSGTGTLTNALDTSILNLGITPTIATLTATTVGNTVNYTSAAAQTIIPTTYDKLGMSGNGVKTIAAAPAAAVMVNGTLVVTGGTLTNNNTLTVTGVLSGTGTLANATAASVLNLASTPTITTLTATIAGNAVNYTGTGQTIKATSYSVLNISGTAINSGTVTVASALGGAGTLTNGAAASILNIGGTSTIAGLTATFVGNTVNYTGTAAQTIYPTAYNKLGTSGAGVKTIAAVPAAAVSVGDTLVVTGGALTNNNTLTVTGVLSGAGSLVNATAASILNLASTPTITTLTATAVGNIVNYTGAAQTVKPTIYNNLTLSGSGVMTTAGVTVNGILSMEGSATASVAPTYGAAATLQYNTATARTAGVEWITPFAATGGVIIANTGAITLNVSKVLNTSVPLSLGANNLTTGVNILTLAGSCAANSGNGNLSRTSGYVIGNLQLTFPTTASTCIYHVGDSTGYAPMSVAIGATAGGTLTGRVDAGDHSDTTSSGSGIDATKSANHYWTLTAGTLPSSVAYAATFQFCANTGSCTTVEVDAGANTGSFNVAFKSAGIWSMQTAGIRNAYSTQATGISGFGEFAVGEISTNNCFSDSFTGGDNTSPGTNWSVGNKTGAFGNPVIFGNRLRLTNATTGVATWATLQRMIPAAGNKVTLEFDHFAYGGTHADGIGVILSDASVAPQVGAFGGSLGYAQKGYTPISDCTTVGGCPGFAGGWLGIGIDEYGNYSANTEGRNGGSAAVVANSVAVRGSGSGMSGYRFLQGTTTLTPTIDSVAVLVPPHRYRIVVDHTDGIHAWTSVERDTSGGGTAYTTLIGCPPGVTSGCTALDVKDPGYSQNAVPASWNLSITGSTGASTNVHEIDNLSICTVKGLATPALHHIKIEHGGSACTGIPATVIVKACADAGCTSLYQNSVTVTLSSAPGGTWTPASPLTFSGGQATVTLTDATVRTDTLGATATVPTAAYATQCFNGATQTCSLSFAACTFDVIEVGAAANTPIFTKLASTAFNLDVLKLSAGNQTATAVELVDASSGTCSTHAFLANSSTAVPSAFSNATPRKPFSFTYANAAPNVRVRVTTAGPNYSCSTDNFAIRPQTYVVTSSATQAGSAGTPVFRAGTDTFALTTTAAATLYTGTPKLNSSLVVTNLANLGALTSVSFPAATGGISTANGFTYSEVGNFNLSQYALYDDTFAQVDSVKGECTSGFSNTVDANGKFSCQFGSAAAGPFGRFVPDHFTNVGVVTDACAAGAVTYMGQPVSLSSANVVEARNAANGVTKNYVPPYAPGIVSLGAENSDNGTDLSARFALPAGNWNLGVYTLTSANATFTRPATTLPDATWGSFESLDVGLTVTDGDVATVPIVSGANMNPAVAGGSGFTYKKFAGSPLRMRFGRLKLSNVVGSELLNLTMPMEAQYWNGSAWIRNDLDSCTNLISGNINSSKASVAINSVTPVSGKAGLWNITLGAPAVQVTSDVCVDLSTNDAVCSATSAAGMTYLQTGATYSQDPTARAFFGVYQGRKQFIYMRENY
ncbi:MAG: DUF6701 domain-containing protein [Gallionellaceae bacterium]|jgi:MSHA biogenesis protein MshQ